MTTIFSYRVRYDFGSAPNPFWGVCTLVLCKARIRRAAQVGDWVLGFGSSQSPVGDLSGKVVFVMQVAETLTMEAYARHTQNCLPQKIPDVNSADPRRRAGDSIYDFSSDPPLQRKGVHLPEQQAEDLSGKNALLSTRFWYYGRDAIPAPEITVLDPKGIGYRSLANAENLDAFCLWIKGLDRSGKRGQIGLPGGGDFLLPDGETSTHRHHHHP